MSNRPSGPQNKRSPLNQSKSSGWSWSRLAPAQEQRTMVAQSKKTSAIALSNEKPQSKALKPVGEKSLTKGPPPQTLVLSTAGSVSPTESACTQAPILDTAGDDPPTGGPPTQAPNLSTASSESLTGGPHPQAPILSTVGTAPPTEDSAAGRKVERSDLEGSSMSDIDTERGCDEARVRSSVTKSAPPKEDPEAMRSMQRSDSEVSSMSDLGTERARDERDKKQPFIRDTSEITNGPSSFEEPPAPITSIKDSVPAKKYDGKSCTCGEFGTCRKTCTCGETCPCEACGGRQPLASADKAIQPSEVLNLEKSPEQEVASDLDKDKEAVKSSSTGPSVDQRMDIPQIIIQKPSEASDVGDTSHIEPSQPRTIHSVLANERRNSFKRQHPKDIDIAPIEQVVSIAPVSPRPEEWQDQLAAKELKMKKRGLFKAKMRNAFARRTFLEIALGRRLATPTKQALRRLAEGEAVSLEDLSVCA